ncbi:MAG: bifunctional (p)ppGpp synthetase/guanosine-3',5'-bis(diphosphate) 3'-pyrophosphohydrolase [Candidatus Gracilibacteria bacterium]|nr:bifunctional (p)ppGpp synthetase/guanosine-3',5'-bis(diphosphate) 3'-pyrophosphohydrolase [Candidatus Gracilibacteria bacterium]
MEHIIIKNEKIKEKYDFLLSHYYSHMADEHVLFVKMVIVNFKRYSSSEDYVILILLHGLLLFDKIDLDCEHISKKEKPSLKILQKLFRYEIMGEKEKFLDLLFTIDEGLFNLKMHLKYTVILFESKSNNIIISDRTNYYKSMGYIIPYLTLKESKLLSFFQDAYFKQLYPQHFIKTKMIYLDKMKKSGTAGEYIINIVNHLSEALEQCDILGRMKMRKKSYFSIYNKIKRKQNADFLDSIGIRILFNSKKDLKKFEEKFEEKFVYSKKKDYVSKPKNNGYESIHYSFMTPYGNNEIYVELQLRTIEMDIKIHDAKEISHYSYTIKKNKWDRLFKEVEFGYKYLLKYIGEQ